MRVSCWFGLKFSLRFVHIVRISIYAKAISPTKVFSVCSSRSFFQACSRYANINPEEANKSDVRFHCRIHFGTFTLVAKRTSEGIRELMAYSHCTGTGTGQVQGTGPGAMVTNMLHRNVHTGPR